MNQHFDLCNISGRGKESSVVLEMIKVKLANLGVTEQIRNQNLLWREVWE
jgi:hypothetical protein